MLGFEATVTPLTGQQGSRSECSDEANILLTKKVNQLHLV